MGEMESKNRTFGKLEEMKLGRIGNIKPGCFPIG